MKSKNKTIGWIFFVLFLIMINPIPGPDDVVMLKLYSMYAGVSLGVDSISEIYLDYFIFSAVISLILLLLAMYFLNWSWKRLLKKMNLGRFNLAVGLSVLVVIFVSYMNIIDWTTILMISGVVPLIYFLTYRKDKSETLALFTVPIILIGFGFSSLLRFVFDRAPIPEFPCLNNFIVSWISQALGFAQVSNVVLLISVSISFILVFLYVKLLKERF